MKKKIIALLSVLCLLLCSFGSVSAADSMTQTLVTALTEMSRDVVIPALPFISSDMGLDMVEESLEKRQNGQDAGIMGSVIDKALTYTDAETLHKGLDSLRLLDEGFRQKCHQIYQNCEAMSLTNQEQQGMNSLLARLYQKDSGFQTVLANHQISNGMIANFLNAVTILTDGKPVFCYGDNAFSVQNYPAELAAGLESIWENDANAIDVNAYLDTLVKILNDYIPASEQANVARVLRKTGILTIVNSTSDVEPLPKPSGGSYAENGKDVSGTVQAFEVTEPGLVTIVGTYQMPMVYRVQEGKMIPEKMVLYFDGKIVAELSAGHYVIQETVPYFNDCDGWAKDYIEALYARGIVGGKGAHTFAPWDHITREEFVKLIVELFDLVDPDAQTTFADVPENAWYYTYVASAQKYGVVSGVSDTEFGVGANIKRQDMAKIISDVLQKKGITAVAAESTTFKDYDAIADYAKVHVLNVCGLGIISGDDQGNFTPERFATRAEASKMIYGMLKAVLIRG